MEPTYLGVGALHHPPAPLLGGTLILYAEMLTLKGFSSVDVEVRVSDESVLEDHTYREVLAALSKLEKIHEITLLVADSEKYRVQGHGRAASNRQKYVSSNFTLDSPFSLLSVTEPNLLDVVRFDNRITVAASGFVRGAKGQRVLAAHANSVTSPTAEEAESSKGDRAEWVAGIRSFLDTNRHVSVLFVGNDAPYLTAALDMPNQTVISPTDLATQLACIQLSDAFIGMSSGPSTVAMFSRTPYIVFKHPTHHADQMKTLLTNNRYPFSMGTQKIERVSPNREAIYRACASLVTWGEN